MVKVLIILGYQLISINFQIQAILIIDTDIFHLGLHIILLMLFHLFLLFIHLLYLFQHCCPFPYLLVLMLLLSTLFLLLLLLILFAAHDCVSMQDTFLVVLCMFFTECTHIHYLLNVYLLLSRRIGFILLVSTLFVPHMNLHNAIISSHHIHFIFGYFVVGPLSEYPSVIIQNQDAWAMSVLNIFIPLFPIKWVLASFADVRDLCSWREHIFSFARLQGSQQYFAMVLAIIVINTAICIPVYPLFIFLLFF